MYTFVFEKEKDMTWKAGQHGLFTIIHKKIKDNTRPFTVASAPIENVVKLTTQITKSPSDFKKTLLELKKGMKIRIAGPVGNFYLKDNRPTLLIAGGISITPYRSMLKQIEADDNNNEKQINLLYLHSEKLYVFKDELDHIANQTSVKITYLDSRKALYEEIVKFTGKNMDNGNYFISGPKSMVESVSDELKNKNIKKQNIKKDVFFGY